MKTLRLSDEDYEALMNALELGGMFAWVLGGSLDSPDGKAEPAFERNSQEFGRLYDLIKPVEYLPVILEIADAKDLPEYQAHIAVVKLMEGEPCKSE